MGEINWTPEQLEAIETEGKNILVSAAAGSGKTAVLVERVIRKLSRESNPVDLDSLVIVTFTRAAAAQMKSKIYQEIVNALKKNPSNDHLRRQLRKVGGAHISTLDSLCMDIVRENFHELNLDPGFRIADESEMGAIKKEVLDAVLEEEYAAPTDEFQLFSSFYVDKNEDSLSAVLSSLYEYAQSYPEPEKWISESLDAYIMAEGLADGTAGVQPWMAVFRDMINSKFRQIKEIAEKSLEISRMAQGPEKYTDNLEMVISRCSEALDPDCFFDKKKEILELMDADWKTVTISKKDEVDAYLKDSAASLNKLIHGSTSITKDLKEKFFAGTLTDQYEDMASLKGVAEVIKSILMKYSAALETVRREEKIEEFSSVAHKALKVLVKTDKNGRFLTNGDSYVYTETADSLAESISEIIVDEYQDTNDLQEGIINALSAERFGRPDLFMVGDVKQSIYGFRQACPDLFNRKFFEYPERPETCKRILLNSNFRSRKEIVDFVNRIFDISMFPSVGDINYKEGHRLIFGAEAAYQEPGDEGMFTPEVYFLSDGASADKDGEAFCIAKRIEELVGTECVTDSKSGKLRPARYSDIAILTRKNDNPEIEKMLELRAIPYEKSTGKGFLKSFEISLVLNLLKIIDNPYQDIPFAAVMTSPVYGVSATEMAEIRIKSGNSRTMSLYEACREYGDDPETSRLMADLSLFREHAGESSGSDMLEEVIEKCDIRQVVSAMDMAESRLLNLEYLKKLAKDSDDGMYGGLHGLLQMIKQREGGRDLVGIQSSEVDSVKLLTFHKSKGLEFPICFVSRTGNGGGGFAEAVKTDRQLGIGLEKRDVIERTKKATLLYLTIEEHKKLSERAEDLRLLYVALTRAKEKLIVTGTFRGLSTAVTNAAWARHRDTLREDIVMKSDVHMKVLLNALEGIKDEPDFENLCKYSVSTERLEVEEQRLDEMACATDKRRELERIVEEAEASEDVKRALESSYAYEEACVIPVKKTASQLENNYKDVDKFVNYKTLKKHFDDSGNEITVLKGSERGNAYHRFFELLDYERISRAIGAGGADSVTAEIKGMLDDNVSKGMLSGEYASAIEPECIAAFALSEIGKRMAAAHAAGTLRREQQFVMSQSENGETQLIQGIIDAFFIEDGEAVLVDYKTDRNKDEETLKEEYKNQQGAYARAIEAALNIRVKEKILYSVDMGREIRL